jgi:hypothetical protein
MHIVMLCPVCKGYVHIVDCKGLCWGRGRLIYTGNKDKKGRHIVIHLPNGYEVWEDTNEQRKAQVQKWIDEGMKVGPSNIVFPGHKDKDDDVQTESTNLDGFE